MESRWSLPFPRYTEPLCIRFTRYRCWYPHALEEFREPIHRWRCRGSRWIWVILYNIKSPELSGDFFVFSCIFHILPIEKFWILNPSHKCLSIRNIVPEIGILLSHRIILPPFSEIASKATASAMHTFFMDLVELGRQQVHEYLPNESTVPISVMGIRAMSAKIVAPLTMEQCSTVSRSMEHRITV